MKTILGICALAGLAVLVMQTQGDRARAVTPAGPAPAPQRPLDWSGFERSFGSGTTAPQPTTPAAEPPQASMPALDVVDAHWMALTMWGEARGDGEAGMRAVGHVIDNRRRAGPNLQRYVTDTVSEAFQFSCWNPGDPNRAAMLNIDTLPAESYDARMWRIARRVAEEIMSGRSEDPTGGSLFYHTVAVAPRWSDGVAPVRRIGDHLFFRTARRAS